MMLCPFWQQLTLGKKEHKKLCICLVSYFGMQGTLSHFVQICSPDTCPGGNIQVFLFNGRNPMVFLYLPFWVIAISEAHTKVVEFEV